MKYFHKYAEYDKKNLREDVSNLAAGAGAGAGAAALLNPLDIYIKKRQNVAGVKDSEKLRVAKEELSSYVKDLKNPRTMGKAWFHGYGPKALKVGGAVAIQFLLYNKIKNAINENKSK
jgi:hypothetical protein